MAARREKAVNPAKMSLEPVNAVQGKWERSVQEQLPIGIC